MFVTKARIRDWLERGNDRDADYMIVCEDTFSHEYYPSYVYSESELRKELDIIKGKDMNAAKEVYSFNHDFNEQLNESRAWYTPW